MSLPELSPDTPRLPVVIEDAAKAEIKKGAAWLAGGAGTETAARFLRTVAAGIASLAEEFAARIASGQRIGPPQDLEAIGAATTAQGWPLRYLTVYTSKSRALRSASGQWRVFYILPDENGDGLPDVVKVVSVRHAAALPYGATREEDE